MRAEETATIKRHLSNLVCYGVSRLDGMDAQLFLQTGVAGVAGDLLIADDLWLKSVLKARSIDELLRSMAIRQPEYRLHLDVVLGSLLCNIGRGERWQRLEDLIYGQCLCFAPRFVQLMEGLSLLADKSIKEIDDGDWHGLDGAGPSFDTLDRELWGEFNGKTDLFQFLEELYLPLIHHPVVIPETKQTDEHSKLLQGIIHATREGDGFAVDNHALDLTKEMIRQGLPVRCKWSEEGNIEALCFASPVRALGEELPVDRSRFCAVEFLVTDAAKDSVGSQLTTTIPSFNEEGFHRAMCLNSSSYESWPETSEAFGVPEKSQLAELGRPRRWTEDLDDKVMTLCEHPVYGFLIQLFLLESLDAELGEETLCIAGPVLDGTTIRNAEVLYRPPKESREEADFFGLGDAEDVLIGLSKYFGIDSLVLPFIPDAESWKVVLSMMLDGNLLAIKGDRLTMSEALLDRLHGGTLMKNVIRNGKDARDKMHAALLERWLESKEEGDSK